FIVPPNACVEPRCLDNTCQLGPRLCDDADPCTLDACDPRMGCLNLLNTVDVGPSQFLLCPTPMTQAEAQTACTDRGLELASIDTEADATAVATLLTDSGFDSAFIGAASTWLCPGKRILPQVCRALPLDTCPIDESCATSIPFVCETHCNDGDPCTRDFVGADGLCQSVEGGCDDGDPCTNDVCDPRDGCLHTPITGCPADP
ncbi:MAG TPA: C-type lectin domain-containing protein, partial [Myxococcota bacterium]|nr:C-type lectin domain-containing protein [Myxococcota bacterium]